MGLADSLTSKVGPLPAWLWVLLLGGGLYFAAHHQSQKQAGYQTTEYNPKAQASMPVATSGGITTVYPGTVVSPPNPVQVQYPYGGSSFIVPTVPVPRSA